jgi:protein ImuB
MSDGSPEPKGMLDRYGRTSPGRRIAAIVLPDVLAELSEPKSPLDRDPQGRPANGRRTKGNAGASPNPLGVVLVSGDQDEASLSAAARLDAVNAAARRYGVREGQSIAEACALVSNLVVRKVTTQQLRAALESIAEVALAFGATVSLAVPDTVWVDVTGSSHLWGGEVALGTELASRVRALGHHARVAIAGGPVLARAFARFAPPRSGDVGERGLYVVPAERTAEQLFELPLPALPLGDESREWLARLGLLGVADLARLPPSTLAARLGAEAPRVLELLAGRDPEPLVAFRPAKAVIEAMSWDEPVPGLSPLAFALRGLAARVSARLSGRGQAAQSLVLTIEHDGIEARFRSAAKTTELCFKLGSPLWREDEIFRVVSCRLERHKLKAPSIGLRLEASKLTEAVPRQLELSQVLAGTTAATTGEDVLPVVLAELAADVGETAVGVLSLVDSHRPELKSALGPANPRALTAERPKARVRKTVPIWSKLPNPPTRLLAQPLELHAALRVGATLAVDRELYTIEQLAFEQRLEAVEWWLSEPVMRDYLRVWLKNPSGVCEALVYVERESGRRFLQAVAD